MAQILQKLGLDVEIATTDADCSGEVSYPLEKKFIHNQIPIWVFHSPALRKYGFSPRLSRWLQQHAGEYDCLHLHGVVAYPSIVGAKTARKAGVPYIVRPCGELDPWSLKKSRLLKRLYLYFLGEKIVNQAAVVHAVSPMEKKALKDLQVSAPVFTIPLGTESTFEKNDSHSGRFRKKYPETAKKKLVLYLSRLDPKKGIDLLLSALKKLGEKRNDFVLALAGSGSPDFERKVKGWVEENNLFGKVLFCGFLNGSEKREAFRDADLFILPSYDENFGVAPLEAMSAGLPVIVSDKVGISPDISESAAGLVVPTDVESIAQALDRLLSHPDLRLEMGQNGRRLVEEKFRWPNIGRQLVNMYQGAVSNSAAQSSGSRAQEKAPLFLYKEEREFYLERLHDLPLSLEKARRYLQSWLDLPGTFTGKRILEIGAGSAVYSELFAGQFDVAQVTALDLFEEKFAALRRRNRNPRLNFVKGDCLDLPFEDESFDVVFGSLILHRFRRLDKAVSEIRRVLVKGGLYLGLEPSLRNPLHYFRNIFGGSSANEYFLSARRIHQEFSNGRFKTKIFHLSPRFPFLLRIGLSSCVGIRAEKK